MVIQGPPDGAACIAPLLELMRKASDVGARAVIIGCFDDTGLDQACDIAACPVIGIGQAAYHMAVLADARFSVVTPLDVSVPVLEHNIHTYGFAKQRHPVDRWCHISSPDCWLSDGIGDCAVSRTKRSHLI